MFQAGSALVAITNVALQHCFLFERGLAMAVPVSKLLVALALAAWVSVGLVEISAQETPAQTASPAIAGTLSSLERAAGVIGPDYSSPAVVSDTKSLDPAAATRAWLATVPRDQREKSDAYFEGGYWLLLWNFLLVAAISVFLLESRISARLRDFAERAAKLRSIQVACYAIPYFLIVATLSFPLNLYEHFFREHQYGFATQTFLPWFRVLAMARANQIPAKQVFEVDASRQTTRVSANVSGVLGTTRIALNDNLLKQCTLPEIRMVMAHEMGHYVLNHGAKLLTYFGIFLLIGFALTRALFDAAVRRWGAKWRVRSIADPAGMPLLVLILSTLLFIATPLLNTVVRVTEREADAFGINTSREPDGMAKVALKLGAYRKLDPTPLEEFIFFDHPSGRVRIRMAMDWKVANLPTGESPAIETMPPDRR